MAFAHEHSGGVFRITHDPRRDRPSERVCGGFKSPGGMPVLVALRCAALGAEHLAVSVAKGYRETTLAELLAEAVTDVTALPELFENHWIKPAFLREGFAHPAPCIQTNKSRMIPMMSKQSGSNGIHAEISV